MKLSKDWNPELYLKFGNERTQPAIDLVNHIHLNYQPKNIIDIGCGPGNSGQILTANWPDVNFLGIDSSVKMIEKAKKDYPKQNWITADVSQFESTTKYDIVYSNAAIQWIPDHKNLLEKLFGLLSDNGVLALQLPKFKDMPIGKAIERVAIRSQWKKQTEHCSSVFTYHEYGFYYDLLSQSFPAIEMWETSYLHILESQEAIIKWTRSTGMKPYLDSLNTDTERAKFEREVLNEISDEYPARNDGKVIFPFKRLFIIGYKRIKGS
jgi:trans-aconitate 2-methyltransferase